MIEGVKSYKDSSGRLHRSFIDATESELLFQAKEYADYCVLPMESAEDMARMMIQNPSTFIELLEKLRDEPNLKCEGRY